MKCFYIVISSVETAIYIYIYIKMWHNIYYIYINVALSAQCCG